VSVIGTAARRYAAALLDVARERGQEARCLTDLRAFQAELDRHADLREVLANPNVPADAASRALAEVARRMRLSETAVAFLSILGLRRRMKWFPEILQAATLEQERRAGRERGELVTVAPLTEAQMVKVRAAIARAVGRPVALTQRVDPALMGGLRVTVGDRVFDFSTATYLQTLRNRLIAR